MYLFTLVQINNYYFSELYLNNNSIKFFFSLLPPSPWFVFASVEIENRFLDQHTTKRRSSLQSVNRVRVRY